MRQIKVERKREETDSPKTNRETETELSNFAKDVIKYFPFS